MAAASAACCLRAVLRGSAGCEPSWQHHLTLSFYLVVSLFPCLPVPCLPVSLFLSFCPSPVLHLPSASHLPHAACTLTLALWLLLWVHSSIHLPVHVLPWFYCACTYCLFMHMLRIACSRTCVGITDGCKSVATERSTVPIMLLLPKYHCS